MIQGITYTDSNMQMSADLCVQSMGKNGVDITSIYRDDSIDRVFKTQNWQILSADRGHGFWLWKPYVINRHIDGMADGEILIYSDAGVEFITPVREIIDRMDEDLFFFTNTHPQFHWCKRETMEAMNAGRNQKGQAQASVIFIKVNQKTRDFIKDWLLWCQMPGLIDDSKWLEQHREFQDHRHDQAILTNLIYKYGYKMHWWPTAYAEHIRVEGDTYPVMFNHHRKRDPGCGKGDSEW